MKYAVFTVAMPEYEVADAPAKLKAWGYDGVEWRVTKRAENPQGTNFWSDNKCTVEFDTILDEADRLRDMTLASGLQMPAIAFYIGCSQLEDVKKALKATAKMGVPAARIGVPGYNGSVNYNELFKQAVEQYKEVEKVAADNGVRAMPELHMGNIIPSASAAYRFVSNFDPKHVGAIYDPGNMIYEGFENWQLGCELLGPWLAHVHAKNASFTISEILPWGQAKWTPGMGTLRGGRADWLAIMKALKSVGYDGWLSLEDFATVRPVDERLTDDVQFLKLMEEKTALC